MKNCKKIMSATLLVAAGYAGLATAHTQSGTLGSAASAAAATDVYAVTCSNDGSGPPAKLFLQVQDLPPKLPTVLVGIQATKGVVASTQSIDTVDGDGVYSKGVTLSGGAGVYSLKVNKFASTVKGAETYVAQFHCQTAAGVHTGTTWVMTQNQ